MTLAPEPGRKERSHEDALGTVAPAPTTAPSLDPPNQTCAPITRTINVIFSIDPTAHRQIAKVGDVSQQIFTSISFTFSKKDPPHIDNSYNDPIVVTVRITDSDVQ
ncbi:hypothetical protein AXF42_Ash001714 [Apostasia shenzhenica]|uniref:Uncharacterized protein n=1 Tax=Apostasia shenzhenica TaxID=1088818 RepID=A0A2I0AB02_9ASPA|nr:hypothetical protein AXF42_Ash001714 [Apostasia shenzhenica]